MREGVRKSARKSLSMQLKLHVELPLENHTKFTSQNDFTVTFGTIETECGADSRESLPNLPRKMTVKSLSIQLKLKVELPLENPY